MKKNKKKIVASILIFAVIAIMSGSAYGHSGRTDSNGGHKDNQNKSGLGSYHYHCGGHPAHLHTNGVCPYLSNSSSSSSSSSSSNSSTGTKKKSTKKATSGSSSSTSNNGSSKGTTSTQSETSTQSATSTTATEPAKPTIIEVTEIKINEKVEELEIGEKRNLTVTITPDNASDKVVVWKSSDDSILSITQNGEIEAKKAGTVEVSATGSNNKSDTILIKVKEQPKVIENTENNQNTVTTVASTSSGNMPSNTSTSSSGEGSGSGAGIGLLVWLVGSCGVSYWAYKKFF